MVTLPPEDNALGNWQNFFRAYIKEPFVSVSVVDAGPVRILTAISENIY